MCSDKRLLIIVSQLFVLLIGACSSLPDKSGRSSDGSGSVAAINGTSGTEFGIDNSEANCSFRAGSDKETILSADFIRPSGVEEGSAIVFSSERQIIRVGLSEDINRRYPNANLLTCKNVVVSPGFINAHEHLSLSHAYPSEKIRPTFKHRDEWLAPVSMGGLEEVKRTDDKNVLAWLELRHLLAGTTTIAGSGAFPGIIKNAAFNERIDMYPYQPDMATFPYTKNATKLFGKFECPLKEKEEYPNPGMATSDENLAYVPHVGEGVNCTGTQEVQAYIAYVKAQEKTPRQFSIIHAVAADEKQIEKLVDYGVPLIWSPRSNMALYGQTADVRKYLDEGGVVALGTDWAPSGSFNILEEVKCARSLNSHPRVGPIADRLLWEMMTINAAKALGIDRRTGLIERGYAADLIVIRKRTGDAYADVVNAIQDDILAVFIDGRPQLVSESLAIPMGCSYKASIKKGVCIDFRPHSTSFEEIESVNEKSVPVLGALDRQAKCGD